MSILEEMDWWILRDGEPAKVTFHEYNEWMRLPFEVTRRIAETLLDAFDGSVIRVSTVFLAVDHSWGGGPPILFETMVFGGPEAWDGWQDRYMTLSDARAGHKCVVEALRKGEEPA